MWQQLDFKLFVGAFAAIVPGLSGCFDPWVTSPPDFPPVGTEFWFEDSEGRSYSLEYRGIHTAAGLEWHRFQQSKGLGHPLRDVGFLEVGSGGFHVNGPTDVVEWEAGAVTPFMAWDRRPGHYESDREHHHFEVDVAGRGIHRTVVVEMTPTAASAGDYVQTFTVNYHHGDILPRRYHAQLEFGDGREFAKTLWRVP